MKNLLALSSGKFNFGHDSKIQLFDESFVDSKLDIELELDLDSQSICVNNNQVFILSHSPLRPNDGLKEVTLGSNSKQKNHPIDLCRPTCIRAKNESLYVTTYGTFDGLAMGFLKLDLVDGQWEIVKKFESKNTWEKGPNCIAFHDNLVFISYHQGGAIVAYQETEFGFETYKIYSGNEYKCYFPLGISINHNSLFFVDHIYNHIGEIELSKGKLTGIISGKNSLLNYPWGISVDAKEIAVSNTSAEAIFSNKTSASSAHQGGSHISFFKKNKYGNITPTRVIDSKSHPNSGGFTDLQWSQN